MDVKRLDGGAAELTEQARTEEALRKSEERLALAASGARIGIYEWNVLTGEMFWTEQIAQHLGLQTTTTTNSRKYVYHDWARCVHPEDLPRAEADLRRCMAERAPFEAEYRVVWPDGSVHWIADRGVFHYGPDGRCTRMLGMSMDVTERKQAEDLRKALTEQEKLRLGAAVEQASDAVIMLGLDGTIQYVNSSFEALNGTSRSEAVGRSYFDFLAGQSPDLGALKQALAERRPWHGIFAGTTRRGHHAELDVTVSQIKDPSGTAIGHLVTEKDKTQENALERHLRESQKMEALGTLAGGITHDFNNLLAAISMSTEIALLDLEPSHPARANLPTVLKAVSRGKDLVKQIITFSRQKEWDKEPLALAPLFDDAVKFLRSTLPNTVTIRDHIASDVGAVFGNSSQIYQVVVNIAQNAAQSMEDAGGVMDLRLDAVEVDEDMAARYPELKPGPYAKFTAADTGCGISQEHLARLFEPFFTTRKSKGGSGLGLAVVHGIVKNYGGAILVESKVGQGSVFQVFLPRWEGPLKKGETAGSSPSIQGGGARLLLVEDEAAQRNNLAKGLRRMGYRVTSHRYGRGALEAFRMAPHAYDLVVTDQMMPGMTGLELAAELTRLRPDIPIIVSTGYSESVDAGMVGRNGIRDLIMKPFTLQEISRLIMKTIESKNGRG